ncbi:hypothetical protein TNCV_119221 [Trichonephila clavipes]|nr:hypothetical protein TNCV_119221 [Trichonephila clavipes]
MIEKLQQHILKIAVFRAVCDGRSNLVVKITNSCQEYYELEPCTVEDSCSEEADTRLKMPSFTHHPVGVIEKLSEGVPAQKSSRDHCLNLRP